MVVETIAEREKTSRVVLSAVETRSAVPLDAEAIADTLAELGIDQQTTLWTVWRLIDENRLFLDSKGKLVLENPGLSDS